MSRPSTMKIDVTKIVKEHLFRGEKGVYLDVAIWPNRGGPDKYGNTHYVVQEVSKEARQRGEKGVIIGNAKIEGAPAAPKPPAAPARPAPPPADDGPDDIPF